VFVYASTTATGYSCKRMIDLNKNFDVVDVRDTEDMKNGFQIVNTEKSFTVFGETPEEKKLWMKAFAAALSKDQTALTEFSQQSLDNSSTAPVWIPDNKTKICMLCATTFTVVKRRHHCRNCGKVVCGTCSNQKKIRECRKRS